MRRAAAILMIISGIILLFSYAELLATYGVSQSMFVPSFGLLPSWMWPVIFTLSVIAALSVIAGGVFTLQRKHWRICLAASIPSAGFLLMILVTLFFVGILPLIFVCLRKREWES